MSTGGLATIGLLGCGVVGGGVADRLLRGITFHGRRAAVGSVLVRNLSKPRFPEGVRTHLTLDADRVLHDPLLDVLVECLGGVEPAATYVETALRRGIPVITANKAMIADRGIRLEAIAAEHRTTLAYEAAVGGAVPILRTLRHYAATDEILEVSGIVNGTTNFVLSAMEGGLGFDDAVAAAQRNGFAEADPSTDIEGTDAVHKLSILAATAFGSWPRWQSIARRGIAGIGPDDVEYARQRRGRIKLAAVARRTGSSFVAGVGPTFVPQDHPFAQANGAENVFTIVARNAGPIVIGGLGAGREPTASAVIGDLLDVLSTQKFLAADDRHRRAGRDDIALTTS